MARPRPLLRRWVLLWVLSASRALKLPPLIRLPRIASPMVLIPPRPRNTKSAAGGTALRRRWLAKPLLPVAEEAELLDSGLEDVASAGAPPRNGSEPDIILVDALEAEVLDGEDMLRVVDEDDALWKTLDELPVVSNPLLAAVAPEEAIARDDDVLTRRKIRATALPLFVVWLAAPTLSLIDTAVVGRFSTGALDVAALAPAVSFADSLSYLMSFLAIVTTNKVAKANAANDLWSSRAAKRDGVAASLGVGCLLALAVHVGMGHAILANVYVSSSTQAVLPLATTYVLLRNVALPFQLAWQTVQAASVARGDCKTPLKATFVAAVVNVVFDVILVAGLGMGVAGAALATALATVAGCVAQVTAMRRLERDEMILEAATLPPSVPPRDESVPDLRSSLKTLADSVPFFLTFAAKTVVGVVLTAAAAGADIAALAAHQVVISLFFLLCPFADALSSAAQSLAPRALSRARQKPKQVLRTVLLEGAMCAGAAGLFAAASAVFAAGVFTADPTVLRGCAMLAPALGLSLAAYIFNTIFEGTLFAFGHARPIGLTMPFNAGAVAFIFLTIIRSGPNPLLTAWLGFVAYQLVRIPQLAIIARRPMAFADGAPTN